MPICCFAPSWHLGSSRSSGHIQGLVVWYFDINIIIRGTALLDGASCYKWNDGRSENDWLSTLWFQVDLKIKKRFRTFWSIFDFFYYLKVVFTLQNRFSNGHFSIATPMSAVTNIVSAFWRSNSVKYHRSLGTSKKTCKVIKITITVLYKLQKKHPWRKKGYFYILW